MNSNEIAETRLMFLSHPGGFGVMTQVTCLCVIHRVQKHRREPGLSLPNIIRAKSRELYLNSISA